MFKVGKEKASSLLFSLVFFCVTYYLSSFYVNGDQFHYKAVYDKLSELSLIDAYIYYNSALDSNELVHFFLVWLFSGYVEKDILMSFFNASLVYYVSRILFKHGGAGWVIFLVLLTSFYSWVLFLSAERLKIAMLLFMMSFWYLNNGCIKKAGVATCLSILAHLQIVISYFTIVSNRFVNIFSKLVTKGVVSKYIFLFLIVVLFLAAPLSYQVVRKFDVYVNGFEFVDLLKWLIYYLLTLSVSVQRGRISWQTLSFISLMFIPMLVTVFFIGSDRALFFAFFVFVYFAVQKKSGLNFPLFIVLVYFCYKSVFFIVSVFNYGDGFVG